MSDSSPHPSTASPSYSQPKPCDLSLEPEKQNEQTDNDLGRRDSDSLDHTDTSVPTNAQKYPSTLTSSSDGLLSTTSQQACQIIYSKPITDPAPEPTPIQDDTGDNQEEIASQKSQSQGSTASAQSARSSDRLPIDSASKSPPKDELAGKMEEKLQVTTAEQNWKGINSTSKKGKERSPYPQRSEVRKISVGGVKQKSKEVNTMKNLEEKLKGGKERQRFQWARPTSDLLKQRGVDLPRYLGSLSTPPAHLRNILEPPPDPKPIHRRVSFATEIEFINGPYSTPSGSSSLPSSRPREISPVSLSRPERCYFPHRPFAKIVTHILISSAHKHLIFLLTHITCVQLRLPMQ
ncbi:hypothetical protein L218DRAFT_738941 [Marasmius fiardii PR-910]|nr:hypothetical protein L218DRAFT_738941 [Marasmius fiardii PR-910]